MTATEMPGAHEYSWHLSDRLVPPAAVDDPTHLADADDATVEAVPSAKPVADAVRELPPLWYRIATGQSFIWRIRWVQWRVRERRRRFSRRALRWLTLHPEVRIAARSGRLVRLVYATALSHRRPPSATHIRTQAPPVHVSAILTESFDAFSDVTGQIKLATSAGPVLEIGNSEQEDLLVVRRVDGNAVDVLHPVDPLIWRAERFTTTPSGPPARLRYLLNAVDERTQRRRLELAQLRQFLWCTTDSQNDPIGTARSIIEFATARVPLAGVLTAQTAQLVGSEIAALVSNIDPDTLDDNAVRERYATRLRRAALTHHSGSGWWRHIGEALDVDVAATPSVSVLLPSNRPEDVLDAARRVNEQCDVDVQLVVGLHGSHMSHELDEQLASIIDGDLVVVHLDDELNLGQVLAAITERADGRLISKWDDDDWYDSHHLVDLCRAMESTGATLIGKAAEFVYLEQLDLTIRRFASGGNRYSTTIAGGTLLVRADDLAEVGWANAPRRVDRLLIEGIEAGGGTVYRTHGLGYILRRRGGDLAQHTWAAGDEYFLGQAVEQRKGLDFGFAGFGDGS
tara:strand:- start:2119 stop:3828 length:1710 start_codon:yes stop_codon:yes gene_type:complete